MKSTTRVIFGVAIGCSLGAAQAMIETLLIAFVYRPYLLQPITFFNNRLYDGFTKIFMRTELPAPALTTLDRFIAQGFTPKLAIAADLLLVNFIVGSVLGIAAALLAVTVSKRARTENRRFVATTLAMLVVVCVVVHLGEWFWNLHLPVDPTVIQAVRNAGRNFLHDGTAFALVVLAIAAPFTAFLLAAGRGTTAPARLAGIPLLLGAGYFALAGGLTATATAGPARPAAEGRLAIAPDYNIVLISIDSLRADHLSAYGYRRDTSPTMAALARDGVLFRNNSATTAWTLPGHMSILTGRSLLGHGVVTDAQKLGDDIPTLAESLRGAGYTTHGVVSAPYVEARYGFDRGFDSYDDQTIRFATHGASYKEVTAPLLQRTAAAWLDANANRKFFLFLHYWDVHYDYAPGSPYDTMFDPHYEGSINGENFYFNPAVHAQMPERDLEHVVALYDGEIRLVDDHLAMLRAKLEELGIAQKTIIVVTSDHGDEFFEHGRKGHHRTLYDEIVRVPLILYVPGAKPNRGEVTMETSTIDIMPTLLGLVGAPLPPGIEGIDLTDVSYLGRPEWDRTTIAELYRTDSLNVQVALRRTGEKLIHHFNDRLVEMYDIATDPGERARLPIRQSPATAMMADLSDWLNTHWAAYRGRIRAGLDRAVTMDTETEDRLRALGYIE
jgi:arylsulfatase A-like enzyme